MYIYIIYTNEIRYPKISAIAKHLRGCHTPCFGENNFLFKILFIS